MKQILVAAIFILVAAVFIHDSLVFALDIVNGGGATDFCARFLDAEDRPLKEITLSIGELRRAPSH